MRWQGGRQWGRVALTVAILGGLQACGGGRGSGRDQTSRSIEQYALAVSPDGRAVVSGGTYVVTTYAAANPYDGYDPTTTTLPPEEPSPSPSDPGPVEDVPPDNPAPIDSGDTTDGGSNAPPDESNAGEGDLDRKARLRNARRRVAAGYNYRVRRKGRAAIVLPASSARGQAFALAGSNRYIDESLNGRLWFSDAQTGKLLGNKGLGQIVYALAYSPDGSWLAAGSQDKSLRILDAQTGIVRQELKGHRDRVSGVAFSPDSLQVASAGYNDHTVRLWDTATGTLQNTLSTGDFGATSVAFAPDGKTLAGGAGNGAIYIWDARSGAVVRMLVGHKYAVWAVAFAPDGQTFASGSADNTVIIWDAASGTPRLTLTGHTGFVFGVKYAPDGQTLASGGADRTVRVWDAHSGALLQTLAAPEAVQAVDITPDSQTVIAAGVAGNLRAWNAPTGQIKWDARVQQ